MIGGQDIIFQLSPGIAPATLLEACVRAVRSVWPSPVVEDDRSGAVFTNQQPIPFAHVGDLFVYRDDAALQSWNDLGADPSNADSMIHLLVGKTLTVVVHDPTSDSVRAILRAIEKTVTDVQDHSKNPARRTA